MTTETKPDNTIENTENSNPEIEDQAAKNKAVFGPLGKYAVIAVIMVSVIVTTAIMMNKDLGSVEGTIASIEDEVSEMASTNADAAVSETENNAALVTANVDAPAADVTATPAEAAPAVILSAETVTTAETVAVAETSAQTAISDTAANTQTENAVFRASPEVRHEKLAAEFQARIEANKLEQKQHMTEMFTRIKEQEAQQLDQYKSYQDAQVERLREQIAMQQQMIETLVSRNKELYELRAANVQQHQSKREEIINRI
jgi:hypothetical protein